MLPQRSSPFPPAAIMTNMQSGLSGWHRSQAIKEASQTMQAAARRTPVVGRARRYRSQPLRSGPCAAHPRRSRGCAERGPHERLANPRSLAARVPSAVSSVRSLIRLIRLPREKHVAAALAYRRAAEGAPDEEGKEQLGGQLPQTQPRETC